VSSFEFVLVLFSIIVGLGISVILSGWAQQLRARNRLTLYPLQVALSAAILFFSLTYLWGLWTFRTAEWTFPLYILVAAPGLALALAAHLGMVDTSPEAPTVREQYFISSGPIFTLLAALPIIIAAISFTSLREQVPNPANLPLITGFRVVLSLGLLLLARSRNERLHWVGISIFVAVILTLSARFTIRLISGAA
jgi:hypothetical protein